MCVFTPINGQIMSILSFTIILQLRTNLD